MLPKPALLSSIEVPEPALSLSSAGLALLRVLAVSMYFIGTIPDNGTTQPALYRPPHCMRVHQPANTHINQHSTTRLHVNALRAADPDPFATCQLEGALTPSRAPVEAPGTYLLRAPTGALRALFEERRSSSRAPGTYLLRAPHCNSYFAQLPLVFGHFMSLSGGLLDFAKVTWRLTKFPHFSVNNIGSNQLYPCLFGGYSRSF